MGYQRVHHFRPPPLLLRAPRTDGGRQLQPRADGLLDLCRAVRWHCLRLSAHIAQVFPDGGAESGEIGGLWLVELEEGEQGKR